MSYGRVDVIEHAVKLEYFTKMQKKKQSSRADYVVMTIMLNGLNDSERPVIHTRIHIPIRKK